jgi:hypothetical protein
MATTYYARSVYVEAYRNGSRDEMRFCGLALITRTAEDPMVSVFDAATGTEHFLNVAVLRAFETATTPSERAAITDALEGAKKAAKVLP